MVLGGLRGFGAAEGDPKPPRDSSLPPVEWAAGKGGGGIHLLNYISPKPMGMKP